MQQKTQEIIEQYEQQKEKFKTWKCCLEETLELKTQEIMDQNKRQKDENEGGRLEVENMLEARMQQRTNQTEQQRENNEDWKLDLENNLLKLINQNKMDSRISELQSKEKLKCGGRTLSREYRNSRIRRSGKRRAMKHRHRP